MLFAGGEMERTGCYGVVDGKEGDINCVGLEKEMEMVVWELW